MKTRMGFVSNSSSSSFVCSICEATESGWDMSLSEAGMVRCVNEHTFCEEHLIKTDEKILDEDQEEEDEEEDRYEVSEKKCPICQLKIILDDDLISYFLKRNKIERGLVEKEIQNKFSSYKEFMEFLK